MTRKQRRIGLLAGAVLTLGAATGLVLFALEDSIVYFYSPSDLQEKRIAAGQRIRIGGLVEEGTVVRGEGLQIGFAVTDLAQSIPVTFTGVLPDLFREGQGVVAEGELDTSGRFVAESVLAKHDENYMPPEVADALKKSGVWEGGGPVTHPGGAGDSSGATK